MANKNIIFDFDGVIINSHMVQEKALRVSYNIVVGEGTPPMEAFFNLSGDSLPNIFRQLNLPQEMIPIYKKVSSENKGLITIYNGMLDILISIEKMNYSCALCTGKDRVRTIDLLKQFNIKRYFDKIVCADDVENPKPHPQSINKIIFDSNWDREDTYMIGDGINDIKAARNAGIKSVGVTWGECGEDALAEHYPTYIVRCVKELEEVIIGKGKQTIS